VDILGAKLGLECPDASKPLFNLTWEGIENGDIEGNFIIEQAAVIQN
jgi:hypothetical protein